MAVGGGGH